MHALDRDAAQGEVFGELAVVRGDVGDVGAEPFGENIHGFIGASNLLRLPVFSGHDALHKLVEEGNGKGCIAVCW